MPSSIRRCSSGVPRIWRRSCFLETPRSNVPRARGPKLPSTPVLLGGALVLGVVLAVAIAYFLG